MSLLSTIVRGVNRAINIEARLFAFHGWLSRRAPEHSVIRESRTRMGRALLFAKPLLFAGIGCGTGLVATMLWLNVAALPVAVAVLAVAVLSASLALMLGDPNGVWAWGQLRAYRRVPKLRRRGYNWMIAGLTCITLFRYHQGIVPMLQLVAGYLTALLALYALSVLGLAPNQRKPPQA